MTWLKSQHQIAITTIFGGFSLGNVLGWSSPALPNLEKDDEKFTHLQSTQLSWIASIVNLGALLGAICAGYSIERLGRTLTLCGIGALYLGGWLIIYFANDFQMLYVGRLVSGVALGGFSLTISVYLSEIAEPKNRGFLISIYIISGTCGILYTFLLENSDSVLPPKSLPLHSSLHSAPRFLFSKGKNAKAIAALTKLRNVRNKEDESQLESELVEIEKEIASEETEHFTYSDLISKKVLRALVITIGLMTFNQLSGSMAVGFYTVTVFEHVGFGLDAHLSSIVVGAVNIVGTVCGAFLVDKMGRRKLLMVSFGVMTVALIALGTFFYLEREDILPEEDILYWIPLVAVVVFNFTYYGGVGVLVWTVMGEVMPQNVVGFGSGLATGLNWTLSFVTTKFFPDLNDALGIHFTFWLFSAAALGGLLFTFFIVLNEKYT